MVERRIILLKSVDDEPYMKRDLEFISIDIQWKSYGKLEFYKFYVSRATVDFVAGAFRERGVTLDDFQAFRHLRLLNTLEGECALTEIVAHPQMRKTIAENLIEGYTLLGYQ